MMSLVRWSPRREFAGMHDRFNRIFNEPFFHPRWLEEDLSADSWNPAVDILDQDGKIVIKAELPGVDKKNINVDVKDRVLTLTGERNFDHENNDDKYYRRERVCGKFQRAFTLPANLNPEEIKADFKDGVLVIELPKPASQKARQITVH